MDDGDDIYEIIDKYIIIYSKKNDKLYIKDFKNNYKPVLSEALTEYNIFLNTLAYKIDKNLLHKNVKSSELQKKFFIESSFETDDSRDSLPIHEKTEQEFYKGLPPDDPLKTY